MGGTFPFHIFFIKSKNRFYDMHDLFAVRNPRGGRYSCFKCYDFGLVFLNQAFRWHDTFWIDWPK